jgi:hypothetical protein
MPTTAIDLAEIHLEVGAHASPKAGFCVMELAAYLAHEKHSDHPQCVSPVLGAFLRNWNDSVDDEFRQRLKPYAARVLNTAGDGLDERRAWMATDWLIRVCAPAWLDLAKLPQHGSALRAADEICDAAGAERVQPLLNAAWAAAWAAAGAAAGAAAWAAAWAAAGAAAGAAAWAAFKPTVERLQQSALELLDRMILAEAPASCV